MKSTIFLILLIPSLTFCQTKSNRLVLEYSTGVATGWWVYNKGTTDPGLFNTLGIDRTNHAVFFPIDFNVLYKFKKIKLGAGVNYSLFFASRMRSFEDSDNLFSRYKISDGTVKFKKLSLQTEFDFIEKGTYTLSPNVRFGIFKLDTIHPEKANFGRQTFWEFGISNEIRFSRFGLVLRPKYNASTIQPEAANNKNEKHNLYNFGLDLGIRYWIK